MTGSGRTLVRLPGGSGDDPARPRTVLVHPGAIPVAHYRPLAQALRADSELVVLDLEQVPEYFQAAFTGGRPGISIDGIADRAAQALRELPPAPGEWVLAGWSFGGVVAHALLDRLTPAEQPAHVVVLDALAPVPEFTADGDGEDAIDPCVLLGWFAMYLAAKRGGLVAVEPEELVGRPFAEGLERVLGAAIDGGALRADTTAAGLRKVFAAYRDGLLRNNRLVKAHRPRHAHVPFTVLRPERGLVRKPGALGWDLVTHDPRVLACPGDHYTMLREPETVARFAGIASEFTTVPTAEAPFATFVGEDRHG